MRRIPVGAIYNSNAGQTIVKGASTVINFEDKVYDPLNLVSVGGGWIFTAPEYGLYSLNYNLKLAPFTSVANEVFTVLATFNSVANELATYITEVAVASTYFALNGSIERILLPSQTCYLSMFYGGAVADRALINAANSVYISIFKK